MIGMGVIYFGSEKYRNGSLEKTKEHTKTGPTTRGMGVEWLWKFTSCHQMKK
jgi:hypothetical protein